MWLGKLTALDITPLGWLDRKTSTQRNKQWRQPKLSETSSENNIDLLFFYLWKYHILSSIENNIDLLFFTCENIIFFHLWKYQFYPFQIYIDFTACNEIKIIISHVRPINYLLVCLLWFLQWETGINFRKHAYSYILKILPPKNENFQIKNSDIFHISAQNIDCGYSLEPHRRDGSNEYPQSMCLSSNKKKMYTPVNPSFPM